MRITMLKSKIHRATVTEANLNYVGSITIDKNLMDKSNILEYEKVQIVDIDNGSRFETYAIAGEKGSGVICLNGAAARMVQKGDKVIIMSYCNLSIDEAKNFNPTVLFVNQNNSISEITNYERHGEII
ncbi:aspartate 1-decarboxylase [Clostridium sporogenes]|uniref:Aspartate 1-decarboxylase n=1 Tax=Clostridium botulinum TaxID=1491 RepID=A0A6M0T3Y0_CLOBO|nr:aspartate 1-decarboxylase [Clostridium sporogenes]NFA62154.1 aspartate 1-decarboxylase [Clostridium botulinum]NFI73217.1 aspartate 1-decarboxylase [Clostridium sporogenes]NFL73385.1 aspartate 1-decarboxylase [Clostridium sporogenes]NFM24822.1 aspartate 1-decarboxylase [Clostridium sporogenes]NFP63462.1 aspartate 1-decarboxylase [Clostridium sporogenes]